MSQFFWPCFSGRLLLLCTYFTRPLKFYGNVFSIVLFFVLVLIPVNILYVWAGICLWCFQDFHMKRKGRRLWNPDYFLSCSNYLVKRLRKEKKNSKKRERFSSNEDDDREVDFSFCLSFERTLCLHTILMESSNFIEYLLHVCIAPRSDHCLTMRVCFAKRWCLRRKQIKVVTCICVFLKWSKNLMGPIQWWCF